MILPHYSSLSLASAAGAPFLLPPPPSIPSTLSTIALVTCSDMIPFVPCQPLAITLGASLGIWAFPICVLGQTLAGIISFSSARAASNTKQVEHVLSSLSPKAQTTFQEFQTLGTLENKETILLALIALRLAPFFPFSAGNYLLGGATRVPLEPFILATILGCILSNFISVSIGMGGNEILQQTTQPIVV